MTMIRVINVRVDSTLEYNPKVPRLDHRDAEKLCEEQGVESGKVPNVEEGLVAKVDWLLM